MDCRLSILGRRVAVGLSLRGELGDAMDDAGDILYGSGFSGDEGWIRTAGGLGVRFSMSAPC